MKIKLASPIQTDSIVDGEGIRTVIWTQGCTHNCPSCHNPETHDINGGFDKDIEEIEKELANLQHQDGITLSGGDPILQVDACLEIAKFCKKNNLNVWCYTGFTFEQLMIMSKTNENIINLLKHIDVLVDGRFHLAEKSLNLKFKGSKNQRIIDVKASLDAGAVQLVSKYTDEKDWHPIYKREKYIYI